MRNTVLELVNDILSSANEDAVSTLGETEESEMVLVILNRAYRLLTEEIDWDYRGILTKLDTATGTTTTWNPSTYPALPWVCKLPTNVESVYSIFYNSDTSVTSKPVMAYREPDWFQYHVINRRGFATDRDPKEWTMFDDQYVVFDSFDSAVENQIASANSEIRVTKFPGTDLDSDTEKTDCPDRF